jgi:PilZ domain
MHVAQDDNDGVAYLRALRRTVESAAAAAAPAPEAAAARDADAGESAFTGPEKRRSPRYKCEGSAEMREEGHDVRTWASFKDISLHGCYVEATATYPVGTLLDLKLEANGFQVQTRGTVRVMYPFLGMGIAFTEMAEDDRTRLRELLRTIVRPTIVMAAPPLAAASLEAVPVISDPNAAMRALIEFFEKRPILPRDEFLRILRKSQEAPAPSAP